MIRGERQKAIREMKRLSQGDIESRTGLFRAYISRIENGLTVPSINTLEKMARGLEVPLYQLFYAGEKAPQTLTLPKTNMTNLSGKDAKVLTQLGALLGKIEQRDKRLLISIARRMSKAR
jgi:transcriptional regulator with XRE-family HTH domain